jgi:hypothetical protein
VRRLFRRIQRFFRPSMMDAIGMIFVAVGMILFPLLFKTDKPTYLWIESPSGKTIKKMPYIEATRIVRRQQGWGYADVIPVKHINRRLALRVLFGRQVLA